MALLASDCDVMHSLMRFEANRAIVLEDSP